MFRRLARLLYIHRLLWRAFYSADVAPEISIAPPPSTARLNVSDPLTGRVFDGRYVVLGRLGGQGPSRLYSASQLPIGREVCLKVMPGVGIQGTARRRFLREASSMAKMQHPNTIHVHDYGITEEGMGFLAMEKLDGRTLQQLIHLEGRLEPKRTIRLFRQVASGVAAAHAHDIIHRDMRPGNVTVGSVGGEEVAKISDFGLIKPMVDHDAITGGQRIRNPPTCHPNRLEVRTSTAGPTCIH